MRRASASAAILATFGALAAAACAQDSVSDKAAKDVLARMQGTWRVVSAETDGEKAPADRLEPIRVIIEGDRTRVMIGQQQVHEGPFRFDAAKSPMTVDDVIEQEGGKTVEIHGIFKVEGDTLTSCVAREGQARPSEFLAKPGTGHTLRVLERVKAADPALTAELKRFEGTWRYASMIVEGEDLPPQAAEKARLVLKSDRFELRQGDVVYRGTFTIDPKASPKTLDVTFTEGPEVGKTAHGIYELEGDTLRECVDLSHQEGRRPKTFAAPAGSGCALQILERVKPQP